MTRVLSTIIAGSLALAACDRLTGPKPASVPCKSYPAVAETTRYWSAGGVLDSLTIHERYRVHQCGMPYVP
jgi:hypothetical protein